MKRRIEHFYDAIRAQDLARIAEWFEPQARLRIYSASVAGDTEFGGEFDGVDAIVARFAGFRQRWTIRELVILDVVVDGLKGAAKLSTRADPKSGRRSLETVSMHFLTFRDERVVEMEVFINEMRLTEPAEALAAPAA